MAAVRAVRAVAIATVIACTLIAVPGILRDLQMLLATLF